MIKLLYEQIQIRQTATRPFFAFKFLGWRKKVIPSDEREVTIEVNILSSTNQITRACSDGSFYSLPVALSFHLGVEEGGNYF